MNNERRTLVFEQTHDGCIGYAPELPDTYAQGAALEEVRVSLLEAMCVASRANGEQAHHVARHKDMLAVPQR